MIEEILGVLNQEIGGDVIFQRIYYGLFWNGPEKPRTPEQWFEDFQWFTNGFIQRASENDLKFIWSQCFQKRE